MAYISKPRGNLDKNPSIWAELSTWGRNLRGKLMVNEHESHKCYTPNISDSGPILTNSEYISLS